MTVERKALPGAVRRNPAASTAGRRSREAGGNRVPAGPHLQCLMAAVLSVERVRFAIAGMVRTMVDVESRAATGSQSRPRRDARFRELGAHAQQSYKKSAGGATHRYLPRIPAGAIIDEAQNSAQYPSTVPSIVRVHSAARGAYCKKPAARVRRILFFGRGFRTRR